MNQYQIPAKEARAEIKVVNSRFISSIAPSFSVDEAKEFITRIKNEFADASHNVPAFIIGHGTSSISHCNDDGEPSGSAGRPVLAVLSGSGLGDAALVVTRYFGGTKLGVGGLVRAYSDAVRAVLEMLPRAQKVRTHSIMIALPYNWIERLRRLVLSNEGKVIDEIFAAEVTMIARFPVDVFTDFQNALHKASNGSLDAEIIETQDTIIASNKGNQK